MKKEKPIPPNRSNHIQSVSSAHPVRSNITSDHLGVHGNPTNRASGYSYLQIVFTTSSLGVAESLSQRGYITMYMFIHLHSTIFNLTAALKFLFLPW